MTVNVAADTAVPPAVVTLIFPVTAPVGTTAVIFVAEFTVKMVAATPPMLTFVAPVKPLPVMTTCDPTGPLEGDSPEITGVTLKFCALFKYQ